MLLIYFRSLSLINYSDFFIFCLPFSSPTLWHSSVSLFFWFLFHFFCFYTATTLLQMKSMFHIYSCNVAISGFLMYWWENSCEMYNLWEISRVSIRFGKFSVYIRWLLPPPPPPGKLFLQHLWHRASQAGLQSNYWRRILLLIFKTFLVLWFTSNWNCHGLSGQRESLTRINIFFRSINYSFTVLFVLHM